MRPTPVLKTILFFTVVLVLTVTGIAFGFLHKEDFDTHVRFSLLDQTGERVTHEDMRGQYLLVYFGFTSCAQTCPLQMSKLSQVVRQLDKDKIEKLITPVFITVDPKRDSVERLNEYLEHFDDRFIGLTGTPEALLRTTKSFNTLFTKKESALDGNYDVAHSSVIYVVDPLSRIVGYIPFEADVAVTTSRVKELIL